MNKSHKKPTGNLSLQHISTDGIKEIPSIFPETKEEQELKVASLFLDLINRDGIIRLPHTTFTQNGEQDLDFTIHNNDSHSFLELTELVPLDNMKGGYSGISPEVHQGKLVERLIRIIKKKSHNYSGITVPIDLLVYATDNYSNISPSGEQYLKTYLNLNSHIFRSVFFLVPFFQVDDGIIIKYYPNDDTSRSLPPFPGMAMNLKLKSNKEPRNAGSNFTAPKKKRRK